MAFRRGGRRSQSGPARHTTAQSPSSAQSLVPHAYPGRSNLGEDLFMQRTLFRTIALCVASVGIVCSIGSTAFATTYYTGNTSFFFVDFPSSTGDNFHGH